LDVPPNTPRASPKVHTFRSSVRSVTEIRMHRITRLDRASKAESTEAAA
jgi:hypothetical protein